MSITRLVSTSASALLALALPLTAFAQTKWDSARRLSGHQLPHREPDAVRSRRGQGLGRQAQDPGARQRVAVQGQRDQARRAGRPGADRRSPAGQLREREPAVRRRRHSLPGHQLRRIARSWPPRRSPRSTSCWARKGMKLLYTVAWPPQGIYVKKEIASVADMRGLKWRAYSPGHRQDRRADRRPAGHHPGRRTVAGAGHRRGRQLHDARAPPATTPRPTRASSTGTTPRPGCPRTRCIVNQKAFDALDKPTQDARAQGRGRRRDARLEAQRGKERLVQEGAGRQGHEDHEALAQADGRPASRSAASCWPTGRRRPAPTAQAMIDAYQQEVGAAMRRLLDRLYLAPAALGAVFVLLICVLMIGAERAARVRRAHRRHQRRGGLVLRRRRLLRHGACLQARRLRARDAAAGQAAARARAACWRSPAWPSARVGRRPTWPAGPTASPTRAGQFNEVAQGLLPMPIWIPQAELRARLAAAAGGRGRRAGHRAARRRPTYVRGGRRSATPQGDFSADV